MSAPLQYSLQLPSPRRHGILRWVKKIAWLAAEADWQWLHPCAIGQHKHLIHHPQLQQLAPQYYRRLKAHAAAHGWLLAPCRRTGAASATACRRKPWVPLCLLSCALSAVDAFAAPVEKQTEPASQQLQAISAGSEQQSSELQRAIRPNVTPEQAGRITAAVDRRAQQRIHDLLAERWQVRQDDPPGIHNDLQAMATYYSQFPSVTALFTQLEQYDWQLQYAPKTFTTQVSGSRMRVDSVNVLFDPRSAAQFKFHDACIDKVPHCFASPADVLLHELLHAKSVLSEPQTFLAQGGMSSVMYPYEHERRTIIEEKNLYISMTAVDNTPRPLRSEHSGRHVDVACATCLH